MNKKLTSKTGFFSYSITKGHQRNRIINLSRLTVAGVILQLYLKERLWHRCFPVNYAKLTASEKLQL